MILWLIDFNFESCLSLVHGCRGPKTSWRGDVGQILKGFGLLDLILKGFGSNFGFDRTFVSSAFIVKSCIVSFCSRLLTEYFFSLKRHCTHKCIGDNTWDSGPCQSVTKPNAKLNTNFKLILYRKTSFFVLTMPNSETSKTSNRTTKSASHTVSFWRSTIHIRESK